VAAFKPFCEAKAIPGAICLKCVGASSAAPRAMAASKPVGDKTYWLPDVIIH
jgi:hypothetical protein